MEPEGSLPHSQVPAICPYVEPARSSPYPHIPLPTGILNSSTWKSHLQQRSKVKSVWNMPRGPQTCHYLKMTANKMC